MGGFEVLNFLHGVLNSLHGVLNSLHGVLNSIAVSPLPTLLPAVETHPGRRSPAVVEVEVQLEVEVQVQLQLQRGGERSGGLCGAPPQKARGGEVELQLQLGAVSFSSIGWMGRLKVRLKRRRLKLRRRRLKLGLKLKLRRRRGLRPP